MKQPLLVVLLSAVLSALVSFLVVTAMQPGAAPAQADSPEARPDREQGTTAAADVTDLRLAVAFLEAEVASLKRARATDSRGSVMPATATDAEGATPLSLIA